jgi:ribonuclease BN (tRNA processing enzyme)
MLSFFLEDGYFTRPRRPRCVARRMTNDLLARVSCGIDSHPHKPLPTSGGRIFPMRIAFLGTNGWYDTETGNTVCTLVQTESSTIILDAGNGIHRADRHVDGGKPAFLFLSHFHVDHIEGLHILAKFRFAAGLTICGPTGSRAILGTFLNAPFTVPLESLPYPARILEMPQEADSLPFPVEALPLRHASLTLGYRIVIDGRTIAYCSDTGYCENAVLLARSADLLITECAYKEGHSSESWPHLNPETAARIAGEAGARRLFLTHFDAGAYQSLPERTAAERIAASIFAATTAATDGREITI